MQLVARAQTSVASSLHTTVNMTIHQNILILQRQVDTSMCGVYIDGRHGSGHSLPGPAASPV